MEARLEDSFTKKDYPVKNDCVHCVLRKQAAVVTFYQSGWRRPCLWGGHSCRAADSWGQATARGFTVTWGQTGAGPFWTHQVRNQGPEPDAVDISRVLKERFETWNLGSTDMFSPGQHRGDRYWNWYIFEVKIQNAVTKFRLNQWWNVTSKNLLRYSTEVQFWCTCLEYFNFLRLHSGGKCLTLITLQLQNIIYLYLISNQTKTPQIIRKMLNIRTDNPSVRSLGSALKPSFGQTTESLCPTPYEQSFSKVDRKTQIVMMIKGAMRNKLVYI